MNQASHGSRAGPQKFEATSEGRRKKHSFGGRVIILVITALLGALIGATFWNEPRGLIAGAGTGVLLNLWAFWIERRLIRSGFGSILGGVIGFFVGLAVAFAIMSVAGEFVPASSSIEVLSAKSLTGLFLVLILVYMGNAVGAAHGAFLLDRVPAPGESQTGKTVVPKILDTSVIIDGRIADICEAGFLDGPLIVPQFVLHELQQIADSSDSLKRNRGRRGLDILKKIQQSPDLDIRIVENDFPKVREVDSKLVLLAKETGGKVMTNDFNLNKVAELQGVTVLNINELANAVKPVVLPGEVMHVHVLKEGKEFGQGVGYLDDGTMVVVDQARDHIGDKVSVSVTSVLQTTAGRMIFTKLRDGAETQRNGN
jgi:uncharacterized protein YacL